MFLCQQELFSDFRKTIISKLPSNLSKSQTLVVVMLTIWIPLKATNCLNIAKTGDPELQRHFLFYSLCRLLTNLSKLTPSYHIVKETCRLHTISRLTPSLDFSSDSVKMFKFKEKQGSVNERGGMQWVTNLSDLSRKKTGCAFHLRHNKLVHGRLMKMKRRVLMRNMKC